MSIAQPLTKPLTAEGLMDLPDDGVHREIIRGEVKETPITLRNADHSDVAGTISWLLRNWVAARPSPRGRVPVGEAGFRLKQEPETFVGIDVAYVSPQLARKANRKRKFYDGPPVLAVEILSPSDQHRDVIDKVELYLEVGTVVWVVDPDLRTVSVHEPGRPLAVYANDQELSAGPYLPGFRVPVSRFFED